MAFIESPIFPSCVSLGATGGPGWVTEIVRTQGGQEYRNQVRSIGLGRWEVAHLVKRPADWQELLAFWYMAKGAYNAFRFRDYLDYTVSAGEGILAPLTATTFQMMKRYTIGPLTHDRRINKPRSGTVTITGGTSVSVDYTNGIVTVASGTPTSWVGQFDVPVRFGIDDLEQEAITRNGKGELLVAWRSIPLVEIIPS